MSPKHVKITPLVRDGDPVVDAPHRDHADRASRAVDELDVRGQEVVDAVLVDRVRVPAAHLHDLVVTAGLDERQDLARDARDRARGRETRRRTSRVGSSAKCAIAVPAWTSSRSPGEDRLDQRDLDRRPRAVVAVHRASPWLSSTETTVIGSPSSPHVMQCGRPADRGPARCRRVTRSRSPSAPRAPARSRRPSARAGRASPAPPPRRPGRSRIRRG